MTCARHNQIEDKRAMEEAAAKDCCNADLMTKVIFLNKKLETLAEAIDRDRKDMWKFVSDIKKDYEKKVDDLKNLIQEAKE